jgi:hypothetical protein
MRAGACINDAASARTGAVQLAGAVERDGGVRIYAARAQLGGQPDRLHQLVLARALRAAALVCPRMQ